MVLGGIEYCDVCGQPRQIPMRNVISDGEEIPVIFASIFATNGGLLPTMCDCYERAEMDRACRAITYSKLPFPVVAYRFCFDESRAITLANKWNNWSKYGFMAWPSAIFHGEWTRDGRKTEEPIPAALLAGIGTYEDVRSGALTASFSPNPTEKRPLNTWAIFREVGGLL